MTVTASGPPLAHLPLVHHSPGLNCFDAIVSAREKSRLVLRQSQGVRAP
jgi:hypothetical protein